MIVFGKKGSVGIGIVGGLGPETSAKFLLNVVSRVRKLTGKQPNIILDNVPISLELENKIISGERSETIFKILEKSVNRLNNANVDIIVIPCNTVHIFFDRLQKISEVPILNIIDETTILLRKFKKIGLLATSTTVNSRMYHRSCEKMGIELILPNKKEQKIVSAVIVKILRESLTRKDEILLHSVTKELVKKGAKAIVLGCTDLQLLINVENKIKFIDSMKALEDVTVNFILKGK